MNAKNFSPSDENTIKRSTNLQVGVVGVILCLNDNIGEVGEAIGEDIGRKVILGLGLWIGRKGDEGIEGGLEEALEEQ